MVDEKITNEELLKKTTEINERIKVLDTYMNDRFDKLKDVIISYLELGNEFNMGSLKTALKNI